MAEIKITGLSGNEIYCMALKGYSHGAIVIGNSVRSMGFLGSIGAGFRGTVGGEITQVTEAIHEGRSAALERMIKEAHNEGVQGIAGVTSEVRHLVNNTEFLLMGSGVHSKNGPGRFFSSAGDAQELYCHMDAGYEPLHFAFGNIAYAVGAVRGFTGAIKTMTRGEIREFSDIFNATRHHALDRMVDQAKAAKANAVVGVRTSVMRWGNVHEMFMSGTAASCSALPSDCYANPVTSDLTGEELWNMTALGYAPIKLLMSTSVYSLGMMGGLKAAFQSLNKGEVNELTTLIYDARENVFRRMNEEAEKLNAEEVVGVKTYVLEIANGLVEIVAIGTAVKKLPGVHTATATLPVQAIIRDKDTWMDGDGGFSLESGG